MRCKKHLPDHTSTIGVCASCLRERLQPLLAAQAQAQAQTERVAISDYCRRRKTKPETEENAPPLNFPRSVSPYVARRKSECDRDRHREKLFYSTPQVNAAVCSGRASEKRKHGGRFWILSNLFRARSNKTEASPCDEPSSSTSWLSTILPVRRQNHGASHKWRCRQADRGISPAVQGNVNDEVDAAKDRSDLGKSSESSPEKQNTTGNRPLTGVAFCPSPLLRASPKQHWTHKGSPTEFRGGGPHHISNTTSLCGNRSHKLAEIGRSANNR